MSSRTRGRGGRNAVGGGFSRCGFDRSTRGLLQGGAWRAMRRFSVRAGTCRPVPKYISSGVCPSNAPCGISPLCCSIQKPTSRRNTKRSLRSCVRTGCAASKAAAGLDRRELGVDSEHRAHDPRGPYKHNADSANDGARTRACQRLIGPGVYVCRGQEKRTRSSPPALTRSI